MKRNASSTRSKKWFSRNCLDNDFCREYVCNLCSTQFEFNEYKLGVFNYNLTALYITYGTHSYIIFADENDVDLKVMEKKIYGNKDRYHEIKSFYGDNCWFECLLWIKNRI